MTTRLLSESGIFTGLSLVVLFLSTISPVNKIFIASASALILEVFVKRNRVKAAFMVYLSTAILSLVFLPYKMIAILYVTLFGGYSLVRNILLVKNRLLKRTLMVIYFNFVMFSLFFLTDQLMENILQKIINGPFWQNLILFFVIQLAVLLYDIGLDLASKILLEKMKDIGY